MLLMIHNFERIKFVEKALPNCCTLVPILLDIMMFGRTIRKNLYG